jgi:Flp pilus assembly pilin Flp
MARSLWHDDSGEISEYALILALILMLGIALISQTGTALKRLYQRVSSDQTTSVTTGPSRFSTRVTRNPTQASSPRSRKQIGEQMRSPGLQLSG